VADGPPPPSEPLALAQAQYRAKQFETALQTLKGLKRDDFSRRDQTWIQYLIAGCLRQLGKSKEAAVIYREIAAAREDAFLAETSVWHLSFLAWRDEVEAGVERRKNEKP
jgi:hypothetical protein